MTLLKCCHCGSIFSKDCEAYHFEQLFFSDRCPMCYTHGHIARIDKKNLDIIISGLRKEVEE